jgi:hypothetical protein
MLHFLLPIAALLAGSLLTVFLLALPELRAELAATGGPQTQRGRSWLVRPSA